MAYYDDTTDPTLGDVIQKLDRMDEVKADLAAAENEVNNSLNYLRSRECFQQHTRAYCVFHMAESLRDRFAGHHNKVPRVKALRSAFGISLREAKKVDDLVCYEAATNPKI